MKFFIKVCLCLTLVSIIGSCSIKKLLQQKVRTYKKGYYVIANKKGEKPANVASYINTNISSVSVEEALFLDDLEMKFEKQKGQNVAVGRKVYIKNRITSQLFPWDRTDLMGEIGICRSQQTTQIADLIDDGEINNSVASLCVKNRRNFTKGQVRFSETAYSKLEDWNLDDFTDALYSFLQSCKAYKGNKQIKSKTFSIGSEADWIEICKIGQKYYKAGYAKMFFERYFSPFQITNSNGKDTSKFTGYYLWEFPVSLRKTDKYWYPIYRIPTECKVAKKCPSRSEINAGALNGRGLEIGWASNPMDVYFMQVQGSGIGVTED